MRYLSAAIACGLALSPAQGAPLADIKVICDRAPDCSSLESIVASVTRECKTDDEQRERGVQQRKVKLGRSFPS